MIKQKKWNHFLNATRQDVEEIKEQLNRLLVRFFLFLFLFLKKSILFNFIFLSITLSWDLDFSKFRSRIFPQSHFLSMPEQIHKCQETRKSEYAEIYLSFFQSKKPVPHCNHSNWRITGVNHKTKFHWQRLLNQYHDQLVSY